jgi:hypothetical protein
MVNEPIKLQDNLYLYSGDVIKINHSNPLLIEIENAENQTIKLRNIKNDKYLLKKSFSMHSKLGFSTNFKNAPTFTIKGNNESKISLQRKDKYLELDDDKEFRLSPKEKWLTITKQQNTEDVANFEEIITINPHKEKVVSIEKLPITCKFYDNKTDNPLEYTFEFSESRQEEHNLTWSKEFT